MRPTAVSFVKMPRFSFATRNSKLIRKRLRDFVSGLRISHRLMLIYFLSIIPVLILSYGLVIEKSKTIEFARKEQRGSSYAAIARDTLLALVEGKRATVLSATELPEATGRNSLTDEASALEAGESQLGKGMNTAALVEELARELRSLDENATQSPAERRALQDQAITTTLVLISRIGEQSNLVLDPDLGSYFLMSMVVLRLPLVTTIAIDLAEMVKTLGPDAKDPDELRAQLLVTEGVFKAATTGFASDGAAALRGIGSLSEKFDASERDRRGYHSYRAVLHALAELSAKRAGGMGASALLEAKLAHLLSTTRDVWLTANRGA